MPRWHYRIKPDRIVPEDLKNGFGSRRDYRPGDTVEYDDQRFVIDAVDDEPLDDPDFQGHSVEATRVLHCRRLAKSAGARPR